jgi:hypothetical protein
VRNDCTRYVELEESPTPPPLHNPLSRICTCFNHFEPRPIFTSQIPTVKIPYHSFSWMAFKYSTHTPPPSFSPSFLSSNTFSIYTNSHDFLHTSIRQPPHTPQQNFTYTPIQVDIIHTYTHTSLFLHPVLICSTLTNPAIPNHPPLQTHPQP